MPPAGFPAGCASAHALQREKTGPFFGWLASELPPCPDTPHLKTMVHLRDDFQRPPIKLEPTYHPLAVDQREGISMQRLGEILGPLGADMGKGGYACTLALSGVGVLAWTSKSPAGFCRAGLLRLVAGTGFEPVTFRL